MILEFSRELVSDLKAGLEREPPLLQILVGARQTGKSTAAAQVAARWRGPVRQASADVPLPPGPEWIEMHWGFARKDAQSKGAPVLLVLDEVQKVRGWSEVVKAQWDADRRAKCIVHPLLLGSSALLVAKGLTESLAGRFFLHRCTHWSFGECHAAFGWDLERWLFFGGYPGAAAMIEDEETWRRYVSDSLVETAVARDVLALERIGKPALLRQLFALAAAYPAEILSYTKMLGTLQDAGNTVTLAHYLRLLEACFLASGLECLTGRPRQRGSSPKIVVWNNALVAALSGLSFEQARTDGAFWGRLVENAAGAHLLGHLPSPRFHVGYWRERNCEVDFVVSAGRQLIGVEVKSGRPGRLEGLTAFRRRFPSARALVIGSGGMPLEEFFSEHPTRSLSIG
ncbi:MAG: ATP-binding protein [Candidatus Riflebacteria bacterium]|nr:ATP-binding protein [Candidatus Riflebacteria bacterium]